LRAKILGVSVERLEIFSFCAAFSLDSDLTARFLGWLGSLLLKLSGVCRSVSEWEIEARLLNQIAGWNHAHYTCLCASTLLLPRFSFQQLHTARTLADF
jgi:hypothetical protein